MSAQPIETALHADPADPIAGRRVTTLDAYERALAFWVATYRLDPRFLRVDVIPTGTTAVPPSAAIAGGAVSPSAAVAGGAVSPSAAVAGAGTELYTYHRDGALIGTVTFREAAGDLLFGQPARAHLPPRSDILEVSKLCIAPAHRDGLLMRRICEDVHARLVMSGRTHLAIAAPRWLGAQYRFIHFRGTGVRFPIPGLERHDLEIMLSRQMRFGIYGMHTDPIRWNLYLRAITDRLLAAGLVHHDAFARRLVAAYRGFAPLARTLEPFLFRPPSPP